MDDHPERTSKRGTRAPARYETDLYSWAVEQAALLRAGRAAETDVDNVAEEIADVGSEQYDRLEGALRIILLHLLKWDVQPDRRSRSWWASIRVQRNHASRVLKRNPGLKARIDEAVAAAYEDARILASAQTRLAESRFPRRCPFGLKDIMERPIEWPAKD